jgi:uncharacterized membrane protein
MTTHPSPNDTAQAAHRRSAPSLVRRWVLPVKPPQPVNPALLKHAEDRAENTQNRIADSITAFSGSMAFVYLHIIWFSCWIGFGVESYPFGLLTMIVSLEAIFLSTFVMISQNRAETKRQVLADQQWRTVQEEDRQNNQLLGLSKHQDRQNKDLLDLSNQILTLTKEVSAFAGTAREDHEQNKQLLDLSKRTLALTKEVHVHTRAGGSTDAGSPDAEDAQATD